MTDPAESELIEMARAGDQDAFGQLYQRSLPRIEAVWYDMSWSSGPEHDLNDFCQDVWLLALRFFGSFRGDCSFATWVVRVAKHKALAILTRRAQAKNGDDWLIYQGSETSDEQWESECSAADDRQRDAAAAKFDIERLMRVLSPQQRELVELFHLRGLSEREIADRQGLPLGTVRSRLSRAMEALRDEIKLSSGDRFGATFSLTLQREL